MNDFVKILEAEFERNANAEVALGQKAYMKNHFEFYGIKSPIRREVQKPFLKTGYLPPKADLENIVKALWGKPQREFQYFSQEFTFKYVKQIGERDIDLFEYMVLNKSWWDTIDYISPKLIGEYFKCYPAQRDKFVEKWIASGNLWLQRSAILFQLNYKEGLDKEFLTYVINSLLGSKEFFINKAIGWVLRQYGKVNPDWVIAFANKTQLAKLSEKEALRLIK
ncbi:MAG: DNA alkylation repair protein [Bacteroidetes bacterium]|nr:MAG: DNA alkylation repair protein [Bacteroidota bacterium]